MRVRAIINYYDLELKRLVNAGEELDMSKARAEKLSTPNNAAGVPLVELVKEEATPTTEDKVVKPAKSKKAKSHE